MTDTSQTLPIQIKHRHTGAVLYESKTAKTIKECVEEAVKNRASLDGASLYGASLDGASLNGASLNGASLNRASLNGASLNGASLDGASLDGASLDGASLDGASLDSASLYGASLDGASLNGASLDGASLDSASLDGASLNGASLNGASLNRASLNGHRIHKSSKLLLFGPIGDAGRTVLCFLASNETSIPYLVFKCGCFTWTAADYKCKVEGRYGSGDHYKGCMNALKSLEAHAKIIYKDIFTAGRKVRTRRATYKAKT